MYVPLMMAVHAEGSQVHSFILVFARLGLASQGWGVGIFLAGSVYHIASTKVHVAGLEIALLVVGTMMMLNLGSLIWGGWAAKDLRVKNVHREEKSSLGFIAIGIIIFGAVMANFSYSWYTALSSLTKGVDPVLMTLVVFALIFEHTCLALGPALFLSLKWKLGQFQGRRDVVVILVCCFFVSVAQLLQAIDLLLITEYWSVPQLAIVQGLLIVAAFLLIVGCVLTSVSAVFVLGSHRQSLLGFVPASDGELPSESSALSYQRPSSGVSMENSGGSGDGMFRKFMDADSTNKDFY